MRKRLIDFSRRGLCHPCNSPMDFFMYAPSQWETTLQCNVVSHWLCAYTKRSLIIYCFIIVYKLTNSVDYQNIILGLNLLPLSASIWLRLQSTTHIWCILRLCNEHFINNISRYITSLGYFCPRINLLNSWLDLIYGRFTLQLPIRIICSGFHAMQLFFLAKYVDADQPLAPYLVVHFTSLSVSLQRRK